MKIIRGKRQRPEPRRCGSGDRSGQPAQRRMAALLPAGQHFERDEWIHTQPLIPQFLQRRQQQGNAQDHEKRELEAGLKKLARIPE